MISPQETTPTKVPPFTAPFPFRADVGRRPCVVASGRAVAPFAASGKFRPLARHSFPKRKHAVGLRFGFWVAAVRPNGAPAKPQDFVGRGGAAERVTFAVYGEGNDAQLVTTMWAAWNFVYGKCREARNA